MLEAHERGLWNADEEKLKKLRELYQYTEDELEGVTVLKNLTLLKVINSMLISPIQIDKLSR